MLKHALFLSLGLLAAGAASAAQDASCSGLLEAARADRNNAVILRDLHQKAERDCDSATAGPIGRALGFALFNNLSNTPADQRIPMLREAALYANNWRIHATLGSDLLAAKDYGGAAQSLQAALLDLQQSPPKTPPPAELVERIVTMANNARALAPTYEAVPKTRNGDAGGVAAEEIAGLEIEAIPFPVEFEFGKAVPTPESDFAIEDMAAILNDGAGAVTLVGHTDPVGSDSANLELSIRRAEAIRDIMVGDFGVDPSRLSTAGCGERTAPAIDSPDQFSQDEIHQMMRRVELARDAEPCS